MGCVLSGPCSICDWQGGDHIAVYAWKELEKALVYMNTIERESSSGPSPQEQLRAAEKLHCGRAPGGGAT